MTDEIPVLFQSNAAETAGAVDRLSNSVRKQTEAMGKSVKHWNENTQSMAGWQKYANKYIQQAEEIARVEKAQAKPESNSDEAWVEQLPASGYVVQLAVMDTQDEMRSFQRSNAAYAKARIMRARHKDTGKRYVILVAGPFETKAQADAFMQSSPLLAKGWLRSTKSMQTQFTKP